MPLHALFVAEGASDQPLATIVEAIFLHRDVALTVTSPAFEQLPQGLGRDVRSRIIGGLTLVQDPIDLIICHRDADGAGAAARIQEITDAALAAGHSGAVLPVVPVRMTEAWLLLDEAAIRFAAGNPAGRVPLDLPSPGDVERLANPKAKLNDVILTAADVTGRRRRNLAARFPQSRRQLLDRLDIDGPVTRLDSWQAMVSSIDIVVASLGGDDSG